jgi:hypothetical protein
MLGLMTDKGFVANANMNDGYSTQDKYSSANLRTNLDIDLTSTTKLKLNLLGSLSESSRPGTSSTDLWDMVYSIPSAAFPILSDVGSRGEFGIGKQPAFVRNRWYPNRQYAVG